MSASANTAVRGATGSSSGAGTAALARGLGWFSLGLGLAEVLAPAALCRATGLRGRETLVRVYGLRELAAGAAILASHDPTPWIWSRVAGDALEPGALAGLISRGERGAGGPSVGFSGGAVTVGQGAAPAGGADVWLARLIPRSVEVTIPRGENGGHTLPYTHVVREMVLLGKWRGEAATFPAPGGDSALGEAALLQTSGAGPILAAAKR